MRLAQGLVQASWWEGLKPVLWWVELSFSPLMGRAMSDGAFWGICELSTAQAACLLMSGAVFLSCQLFGMSSIEAWRQLGEDKSWH